MSTVAAPEVMSGMPDFEQQPANIVHAAPPAFDMLFTDTGIDRMMRIAEVMASGRATVPRHLHGNVGDCFAIVLQAMRWRMDPFAVAQKTYLVNGVLGYEAQLVNAVLVNSGAIKGRPNYEWFGEWEKLAGRFKEIPAKNPGEKRIVGDWSLAEEAGLGVIITATCTGESEPRVLPLLLSQAAVRNSPLWGQDPKQQLGYLAVKRWSRLHTPDVLLGVYTRDELEDARERDMGRAEEVQREPQQETSQSRTTSVRNRLAAKRSVPAASKSADAEPDANAIIAAIEAATTRQQLGDAIEPYARVTNEADRERISTAYRAKIQSEKERAKRAGDKGEAKDDAPPAEATSEPDDGGKRLFSADEIAGLLNAAQTIDALDQAGDLIASLEDPAEREAMTNLFRERRAALDG